MFRKNDFGFVDTIDGLIGEFEQSSDPRQKKMASYAKQARKTQKEIVKMIAHLQESVDYLRVCIKYQCFDLEATRRENAELRSLLLELEDEENEENGLY